MILRVGILVKVMLLGVLLFSGGGVLVGERSRKIYFVISYVLGEGYVFEMGFFLGVLFWGKDWVLDKVKFWWGSFF